jgi:hypothetical protein
MSWLNHNKHGSHLPLYQICLAVVPSFLLFGYNQSNLGGVIGFKDFVKRFPEIDTVNTTGEAKAHNSTIQGEFHITLCGSHPFYC